jgi:transposase-like protein
MVNFRWPDGVVRCPTCGSEHVYFIAAYWMWKCRTNHPRRQFSIKAASIMENSKLGIDKWLIAVWLITNARSGVSSYELARAIRVPQKSAWSMLRRIRLAMQDELTRNHRRARGA